MTPSLPQAHTSITSIIDRPGPALRWPGAQAQRPLFGARADAPSAPPTPDSGPPIDADDHSRAAVLRSFVTALPHAHAATLALIALPPDGVEPVNPVQALQWLLTRELGRTDTCARLRRLAQPLGDAPLAGQFHRFAAALLPRLIEARRSHDGDVLRQAMQEAWAQPLVQALWRRFALPLGARGARKLLVHARRLGSGAAAPPAGCIRQTPPPPGSQRRPARRRSPTASRRG